MDNFIFLCSVKGGIDAKWVTQNCPEMFCEKVILKNFAIFIGKHLYVLLFVGKAAGWTPATILREFWCHVNFDKFKTYFVEHLQMAASG